MHNVSRISTLMVMMLVCCGCGGIPTVQNDSQNANGEVPTEGNTNLNASSPDQTNNENADSDNINSDSNENDNQAPINPPVGATISAGDDFIVGRGELVTLLAELDGPEPEAIVWEPDPTNPLPPEALFFEDNDTTDLLATFFTPAAPFDPLPNTFNLGFTVTAIYADGSQISDRITVTVQ